MAMILKKYNKFTKYKWTWNILYCWYLKNSYKDAKNWFESNLYYLCFETFKGKILMIVMLWSSLTLFQSTIKHCILFEIVYWNISHDQIEACIDGKYGVNCRFDCSRHCLNDKMCNKEDGSCQFCADGYKGIKCNTSRLHL